MYSSTQHIYSVVLSSSALSYTMYTVHLVYNAGIVEVRGGR